MSIKYLVLAAGVATIAAPALAQRTPPTPEERAAQFDTADADKSGDLTLAEMKTTIPEEFRAQVPDDRLQMMFERRDADKDGKLSKAEFTAPMQRPGQ
jgi:Ca2+-binding EF-hand superfamily protein